MGGGWEVTHKAGNTIPWENWLYGAFFRGFQKTAGPRYILFIYRPDVAAVLCAEGVGSAARVGVDMTQMFFKRCTWSLSVTPFPGGMGSPTLGRQHHGIGERFHPIRASAAAAAAASEFSPRSGVSGCPRLPSRSSRGRRSRRLSPPFERSRQMLSRLLCRWARKQRVAFKDRSSAGPESAPPPPSLPTLPQNANPPRRSPASPEAPRAPGSPRVPPGRSLPRSSFPGLGCVWTEQLIYHPVPPRPCGCCLQQRSWEGEKISQVGLGKN